MKTIVRSEKKTVAIDTDGPFVILGEKINPTGRKKLAGQIVARNFDYLRGLAMASPIAGGRPGVRVSSLPRTISPPPELAKAMMSLTSSSRATGFKESKVSL